MTPPQDTMNLQDMYSDIYKEPSTAEFVLLKGGRRYKSMSPFLCTMACIPMPIGDPKMLVIPNLMKPSTLRTVNHYVDTSLCEWEDQCVGGVLERRKL